MSEQPARAKPGPVPANLEPPATTNLPAPETFLSGESGTVSGRRARAIGAARDLALDLAQRIARTGRRLDRLAERTPCRSVLVTGCYSPGPANRLPAQLAELRSACHDVRFALGSTGEAEPAMGRETAATALTEGKLQNVNATLALAGLEPATFDWTVVIDDDVVLPPRFLDRLVGLCEGFGFDLAQPAQTHLSHAAWRLVRRRPGAVARETNFVEIGPVTVFGRRAAAELLPYPDLRMGWGLDAHWAACALARGWRLGIIDSLAVRHDARPIAAGYGRDAAIEEGRRFLAGREYVPTAEGRGTLRMHRHVPV